MNQLPNQNGEDDMSFVDLWRRAVFADATLNTTTKLVAMALTEYADWSTGRNAWPSNATIASMCSCSTKTVTRARASLSDAGLISVREKAGPGGTTICNLLMSADGMDTKSIHVDTESTPMDTESIGYGHVVHRGGTQSPLGMDTESNNPTTDLIKEQEEEDAREARVCTEGVSEHDAMVDTSPSTCREDVQETQPIREEVNQGDEVERKVRVQRIVWDILTDLALTDDLAADLGARSEQELKRIILPGMRVFARAVCLTDWSDGEVEHYVLERVNSFMHRGLAPGRWLSMMASREDMADYNATLMGGHGAAEPVIVMPDPPKQPGDDLPRMETVRIAEGPMHDLMVQMQAEIDRESAERARREDERRERAQLEYERMRRELDKEVV